MEIMHLSILRKRGAGWRNFQSSVPATGRSFNIASCGRSRTACIVFCFSSMRNGNIPKKFHQVRITVLSMHSRGEGRREIKCCDFDKTLLFYVSVSHAHF